MANTLAEVKKMAQRALDILEIQNIMSKHEYYHSVGMHKEEWEDIWAQKTPGVSFGQNHGIYVGAESVKKYYVNPPNQDERQQKNLEEMIKLFPDIENVKENWGIGMMGIHTLTTPVIEVAGDGKTAKGLWYSPGLLTGMMGGKMQATWMWEKYAIDFVKEDGKWKIWHFNALAEFGTPYEKSWVESSLERKPGEQRQMEGFQKPDISPGLYEEYSPRRVPRFSPKPPEPYETFSETYSYGPPAK